MPGDVYPGNTGTFTFPQPAPCPTCGRCPTCGFYGYALLPTVSPSFPVAPFPTTVEPFTISETATVTDELEKLPFDDGHGDDGRLLHP